MNLKRSLHLFLLVLLALSSRSAADAQSVAQPDPLLMTIRSLDTKLFDAYNHCDLTTLGAMVSDDLEFYHDQTGLSVGKDRFSLPLNRTSAERWSGRYFWTHWRCTRCRDMER
jgi:hypothetical protein